MVLDAQNASLLIGALCAVAAALRANQEARKAATESDSRIRDAVVTALKDVRADLAQAQSMIAETLAYARKKEEELKRSQAAHLATQNELSELRRALGSGGIHRTTDPPPGGWPKV